jgi:hypothetical protein
MSGAGTTEVTGSLALTPVPPAVERALVSRRLIVGSSASATWSGGDVLFGGGAALDNHSTFTTNFDGNIFIIGGALANIHNSGLFEKTAGAGKTNIGVPLHNSGTVRVSSGTITLIGQGVGTGHFDLAAGPLELGGMYELSAGTTFSGTNVLRIVGDVIVSAPAVSVKSAEQTFGTQSGTGTLSLENFTWRGGTLSGSGTTSVSAALNLEGGNLFLLGRTLRGGTGTAMLWSSGQLFAGDGGRLINAGLFLTTSNGEMVHHTGALPVFDNLGEFRKAGFFGTGTTSIAFPFNNAGTARVEVGVLRLGGGGAGGGAFVVSEGARLVLADGYTLQNGGSISGAGKVLLSAGTLAVPSGKATAANLEQTGGAIGGAGELEIGEYIWTGGQQVGSGTTSVSQSLKFGAPVLEMVGRSLKIGEAANATWDGGDVLMGGGAAIENRGSLVIGGDANLTRTDSNAASLRNLGTIIKSGGTNVSVFSQVPLDNVGALEISAGTLRTEAVQFDQAARSLTAGTWRVKSGGTLELVGEAGITTNLANVILDGETASFPMLTGLADNRGTLDIKGGRHFTVGPFFLNSGTIRTDATSKLTAKMFGNAAPGVADLGGPTDWGDGGTLTALGGTVILRQDAGAVGGPKLMIQTRGGVVDLRSSQHLAWLDLGTGQVKLEPGGNKVLRADTYSAHEDDDEWEGQLDLGDGRAIFGYADLSPADVVREQLKSGYSGGGASAWTGMGIVSSVAAADPSLALGYEDDATAKEVRIALAKWGDANLDGRVSFADFQRLELGFGQPGGWTQGDFDYSGEVDFLDFKLLYDHFGQALGGGGAAPSAAEAAGLEAFAAAHPAQVPEPSAVGLIGVVMALGARRRRR